MVRRLCWSVSLVFFPTFMFVYEMPSFLCMVCLLVSVLFPVCSLLFVCLFVFVFSHSKFFCLVALCPIV